MFTTTICIASLINKNQASSDQHFSKINNHKINSSHHNLTVPHMGKFSQKAKFLDIYASLPSLSFGKDGKVYSRLGLFLTFLTVVIIGGMATWVGIRIFGRQTPSFIQYQVPPKGLDTKIPWNTDDFKFAFLTALEPEQEDKLISVTAGYSGQGISAEASLCEFPFAPGFKLIVLCSK